MSSLKKNSSVDVAIDSDNETSKKDGASRKNPKGPINVFDHMFINYHISMPQHEAINRLMESTTINEYDEAMDFARLESPEDSFHCMSQLINMPDGHKPELIMNVSSRCLPALNSLVRYYRIKERRDPRKVVASMIYRERK